jgi:hypothetical protein
MLIILFLAHHNVVNCSCNRGEGKYMVNVKKKLPGIVVVFLASALLCLGLYVFNSAGDVRGAYKDNFVSHIRSAPGEERVIKLKDGFPRNVTFLIDILLDRQRKKMYHHTILEAKGSKMLLILRGDGDMQMSWKTSKVHALKNAEKSFNPTFRLKKWNQIGFVYQNGILSTYMNGNPLWFKKVGRRFPFASVREFTLFPRLTIKKQKHGGKFVGKARNIILLNHALLPDEVKRLYDYRWETPYSITLKIFLLFLLFNPIFYITAAFFMKISRGVRQGHLGAMKQGFYKLVLLFFFNVLFFVLFNLGGRASAYFHSTFQFSDEGNYWLILNILFFLVLFTFAVERITHVPLKRCVSLSCFIFLLFTTIWLLCMLPRYGDIYPIIYNILFSFIYTTLLGGVEILQSWEENSQADKG